MSVATLANTTVRVHTATTTIDAMGAPIETYASGVKLKLRVVPMSASERNIASKDGQEVTHRCYAPGVQAINHASLFKWTDAQGAHTLYIQSSFVRRKPGGHAGHTVFECKEVKGDDA